MKAWHILVIAAVIILLDFDWSSERYISRKSPANYAYNQEEVGTCGVADETFEMEKYPLVFKAKCATCHSVDKDATGPKLQGVANHMPGGRKYLRLFIRKEDSLVKAGDSYALGISKSRPVDYNHNYSEITTEQMEELILLFQ